MTYDILLKNVLLAIKRNEHKAYPASERQLITYLLSQLREDIQANRFHSAIKVNREVELFEIQFNYQHICIFTKHRYGALVKAINHPSGQQLNMKIIVGMIESLGLKCEVTKMGNHVDKLFVRVPLHAKVGVP